VATLWLVNGRSTGVDPADRGLAYGDGLFETMAASEGAIRRLDAHFERLSQGCAQLGIPTPDLAALRQEILARCPIRGRAVVKLILTRGSGTRGYRPPKDPKPTRIIGISEWPDYPATNYSAGIELRTLQGRLSENPRLAGIKHLNRLEQVLAQLELQGLGAQEGLLLDTGGRVVSGISSNLFTVHGKELVTPAITRCGVRGVMRRAVLEAAVDVGLDPIERDVLPMELETANEIFVTNALFGIWPVARLDDRHLSFGANTRALMARLGIVECVSASG
jgi:4-amino-4-deoxychorismate lyase